MFKKRENSDGFLFDYIAVTTNTFGTGSGYAGAVDPDNDIGVRTAVISKLIGAVLDDYKKMGWDSGFIFAMPEFLFRPQSGSYPPETLGTLSSTLINAVTRLDREGRGLYVLGSILMAAPGGSGSAPTLVNVVPILSAEMGSDGTATYKCSFVFKHHVSGIDYLKASGAVGSRVGDRIRVGAAVGRAPMPATYARAYDRITGELAKLGFVSAVPQCVFEGIGGGYKLGLEVCLDHACKMLAKECGTSTVGAHLVVSCGMELGVRSGDAAGIASCSTLLRGGATMLCDGMETGTIAALERTGTAALASAFTERTRDAEFKFSLDATTLKDRFGLDASRVSADEAKECFPGGFTVRLYKELKWRK